MAPVIVHLDVEQLVPRAASTFANLWSVTPKVINAWCAKGWIPGAYKHGNGEWWVKPLELIGFDPTAIEWEQDEETEGNRGQDRPEVVRTVDRKRRARLRRSA